MQTVQVEYKTTQKYTKEVIEEILDVKNKEGLTAENIFERAKKKNSPLHDLYDWDKENAAQSWWIHQSRLIINEVKIFIEDKEMYAFENVSIAVEDNDEPNQERKYYSVEEILDDKVLRASVIEKAYEQLLFWKDKYKVYGEFSAVVEVIESIKI